MRRRDLLRWAALAGIAGPTAARAAPHLRTPEGRLSVSALERLDATIEDALGRLRARWAAAPIRPGDEALHAGLAQASEAILVYQAFQEAPLEAQVHPALQRRARWAGRQVAEATRTVTDALGSADPARLRPFEALGALAPAALDRALDDAHHEIERAGGTEDGQRRVRTIARLLALDLREHGARTVVADALEGVRPLLDRRAAPPRLTGDVLLAVAEAQREWIAAGVDPGEFREPADDDGRADPGLFGLGVGLAIVGGVFVVVGIATFDPACPCVAVFVWILAIGLLLGGAVLMARHGGGRGP